MSCRGSPGWGGGGYAGVDGEYRGAKCAEFCSPCQPACTYGSNTGYQSKRLPLLLQRLELHIADVLPN